MFVLRSSLLCSSVDKIKMINECACVLTELYLKSCLLLWVSAYGLYSSTALEKANTQTKTSIYIML